MKTKFSVCKKCGNVVEMVKDSGAEIICCGEKMTALVPNTTEAAGEKHIPVVTVEEGAVYANVGSVTHPMSAEHSIEWIYLETEKGGQIKYLSPDKAPEATFSTDGDKPVAVYAYCNLHGLWASEI